MSFPTGLFTSASPAVARCFELSHMALGHPKACFVLSSKSASFQRVTCFHLLHSSSKQGWLQPSVGLGLALALRTKWTLGMWVCSFCAKKRLSKEGPGRASLSRQPEDGSEVLSNGSFQWSLRSSSHVLQPSSGRNHSFMFFYAWTDKNKSSNPIPRLALSSGHSWLQLRS